MFRAEQQFQSVVERDRKNEEWKCVRSHLLNMREYIYGLAKERETLSQVKADSGIGESFAQIVFRLNRMFDKCK